MNSIWLISFLIGLPTGYTIGVIQNYLKKRAQYERFRDERNKR